MNLLQSAPQPSPHTAHYHADFFPPRHREQSEWLIIPDNHVCLSRRCPVRFMWRCTACTFQSSTQIGQFLRPALLQRSQRFWKGDNYSLAPSSAWLESPGARRVILGAWVKYSGATLTTQGCHGAVMTALMRAAAKIEGRPIELVIFHRSPFHHAAADRFFTNSSPIRAVVMRTSCFLEEEPR